MPSKKKKTPAKPPSFNQSPSPQTPSKPDIDSEELISSLEQASRKFPSFIGKTALIGQLKDAESDSKRRSASNHVWLSESSMLSSSLSPGSLVSVSLAAYDDSFPLCPISSEFSEFEHEKGGNNRAGNYFVIATVFPSSKVLKNEVQLSLPVSYSMGCPSPGRTVFIYPLQGQLLGGLSNGNDRPCRPLLDHSLLHNCKCLHLELVTFVDKVKKNCDTMSSSDFSAVESSDPLENEISSSPVVPLYQSRLRTPSSAKVTSKCDESLSSMPNWHSSDIDSLLTEGLRDETAKQVLQGCVTSCLCSRVLILGNFVTIPILSKLSIFRVVGVTDKSSQNSCSPVGSTDCLEDIFLVCRDTKVDIHPPTSDASGTSQKRGFPVVQMNHELAKAVVEEERCKLGGLEKEYTVLKKIILSTMKNDLSRVGLRPIKGVLIHGPPGTGKTSLARLCAHDAGVSLFSINPPEIIGQYFGESEKAMNDVFDSAIKAAPSVVFIDELDAIAPARKDGAEDLSQRMVATLLHLMNKICRMDGVLVIAATNRPDVIEPALRRSGRLEKEIEIGVPSSQQRFDILCTILSHMDHSLSRVHVQQLAMNTHGFVGDDLDALCNEAALMCIRRYARFKKSRGCHLNISSSVHEDCSDITDNGFDRTSEVRNLAKDFADSPSPSVSSLPPPLEIPPESSFSTTISEIGDNTGNSSEKAVPVDENILKIVFEDFEKARSKIKPSAMREVMLEVPTVKWQDVGGQREVKAQLKEVVEWPIKHQDALERIGSKPPNGVLMFGPPGCSKTLMARAVASEAGLNFLAVKGPELFSKWVGESEKAVKSVFAKARANAPSIIFFDEIDGLASTRGKESDGVSVSDRVISQLLVELDGLHERVNVTVIAATNRPDTIDPALLRPGRFDRLIYVGPPNESERMEIFRIHLREVPCCSDVNINELASLTAGYTGADIFLVCQRAALRAVKEDINAPEVRMQHFKSAIRDVQPTDIQSYEELSVKFERVVPSCHSDIDKGDRVCSSSSNWFGIWNMVESFRRFFTRSTALDSESASKEETR